MVLLDRFSVRFRKLRPRGEVVTLVAPSDSSKTLFARIIAAPADWVLVLARSTRSVLVHPLRLGRLIRREPASTCPTDVSGLKATLRWAHKRTVKPTVLYV